jgi:hypothetical protein
VVAVPVSIEVRFERINVLQRDSAEGAVHLTLNGELLCKQWSKGAFHEHPSGVSRVTVEDFLQHPCKMCRGRMNGNGQT